MTAIRTSALPQPMDDADVIALHRDQHPTGDLDVRTALDEGGAAVAQHDVGPANRPMRLMLDTLTTTQSSDVARVVDQIEENPTLFAVRFLNLEAYVHQLATKVERYAQVATDRLNGAGTEPSIETMRQQLVTANELLDVRETRRRRNEWLEENYGHGSTEAPE